MTEEPVRIGDHASANLRYIREAMERATAFTSIPGVGGVVVGLNAIVAAVIAERTSRFVEVWLVDAVFSAVVAFAFMRRKAASAGLSLRSRVARRFFISYSAPIIAAAVITIQIIAWGPIASLPSVWLVCYGASFISSGAFSIRIVPLMGICFMAAGVAAIFINDFDVSMAVGFGGLHIIFGAIIARNYGG